MAERRDRTERLMNLVLCLLGTSRPVPRHTIERDVEGYADAQSPAAFERMFERDKEELRALGIPIETVTDVDGTVVGYRIPRDEYQAVQLNVTPDQARLISLVPMVWQGEWAHTAVLASTKVQLQVPTRSPATSAASISGSVPPPPPAVALCLEALAKAKAGFVLEFDYLSTGSSEPLVRSVTPRRVSFREGNWYLWGFDSLRHAYRMFRISRMSRVHIVMGDGVAIPEDDDSPGFDTATELHVAVRSDGGAEIRSWALRGAESTSDTDDEVLCISADPWQARWLLLRAGSAALPLPDTPADITDAVADAASRLLELHSESA